ncbi:FAD-dependent oxidoreductase [Cognatishimia sp. F0-27]|uniref:FAD-dependent oxidoreductase n=1 Tax=Cognatishimia sp. F0-27 TaxID=2816855 RepID=UPI001D0C5B47
MSETFLFEGAPVPIRDGQSLAAALTEAGERVFRTTESGAGRGVFCGMGVCQDCLVTVDGRPNQRACMTLARPGMTVARQEPRPALKAPPETPKSAERLSPSVLVIGGGAGGLTAAIEARKGGADVLLLDERKVPGGQYYKQAALPDMEPLDAQQEDGRALVRAAQEAGVVILSGVAVWGAFEGPEIMAASENRVYAITPRALIVATGAYERPAMIRGWDLPGVMTVGAAQTLWRSYHTLPGKRVALFGNGPLTAQVALELSRGGAEIVYLGERAPSPLRRMGAALRMMRHDWPLAQKGLGMIAALMRRGIAVRHDARPVAIEALPDGLQIAIQRGGRRETVVADAVCMNFGFQPQNEILRLLGVRMRYDPNFDQLRPDRSDHMGTSASGVYAIGDCCGLGGAPAACDEGIIAGRAAAGLSGSGDGPVRQQLAAHRRFQDALWSVYAAPPPRLEDVEADVLVCRCEAVTKAALDASLDAGSTDIGAVKRATRVGMGRCQGRYCAPALAGYMARRTGADPQDLSFFAPRVPIKPVDIGTLVAAETLIPDESGDDSAA